MEYSIFCHLAQIINGSEKEVWIWRRSKHIYTFKPDVTEATDNLDAPPILLFITDGMEEIWIGMEELLKVTIHNRINLTLAKSYAYSLTNNIKEDQHPY
jgi:hypothetical protein